jgi:hypothetical protein
MPVQDRKQDRAALGAANAVLQAHSKAIVVSASGDATEYHEMAKSSPYEEVAICR